MTKWKLVPVEPTPETIAAIEKQWTIGSAIDMAKREYKAMLEAAPQPPKSEPIAYIEHHKGGDNLVWDNPGGKYSVLYTAPLVMKLSDERILEIATRFQDGGDFGWDTNMCEREQLGFARAIEREILGGGK